MSQELGITKDVLLDSSHIPITYFFRTVRDFIFLDCINSLCNCKDWIFNDISCLFSNKFSGNDKNLKLPVSRAVFFIEDFDPVELSYIELLYYIRIAAAHYCERHPEDAPKVDQLLATLIKKCESEQTGA